MKLLKVLVLFVMTLSGQDLRANALLDWMRALQEFHQNEGMIRWGREMIEFPTADGDYQPAAESHHRRHLILDNLRAASDAIRSAVLDEILLTL